jgi:hypothetical protein
MEVRLDLEMQTRASNQLLRQMEHKLADEAIMMDEIEVLLGVMRDNLTPSLTTSETQVRTQRGPGTSDSLCEHLF